MTHNNLLNQFKKHFSEKHPSLDFRSDVYALNQYGLSPIVSYERAKIIVLNLYNWAQDYLAENENNYSDFGGWEYNLDMTIDSLRTGTIKSLVDGVINDLVINYKEKNIHEQYDDDIAEAIEETLHGDGEYYYKGYTGGNAISLWLNDNKGYSLADNYHAQEAWRRS